jgi:hypothetical protein
MLAKAARRISTNAVRRVRQTKITQPQNAQDYKVNDMTVDKVNQTNWDPAKSMPEQVWKDFNAARLHSKDSYCKALEQIGKVKRHKSEPCTIV